MNKGKKPSRDAKEACLEALSSVNKKVIEFEGNNISNALGQIEIEMNQEISRKNKENIQSTIQQMNQINLLKISELLVNPSLQYQVTAQEAKKIQEKLPLIQKKMFTFELNEEIEPSIFMETLMDMCTQFN